MFSLRSALLSGTLALGAGALIYALASSDWSYLTTYNLLLNACGLSLLAIREVFRGCPELLHWFVDACTVNSLAVVFSIVFLFDTSFHAYPDVADRCAFYFSAHFATHFLPPLLYLVYFRAVVDQGRWRPAEKGERAARAHFVAALLLGGLLAYTAAVDFRARYDLTAVRAREAVGVYAASVCATLALFCS